MIELTMSYLDDLAALGATVPESSAAARDVYAEAVKVAARRPSDDLRAALDAGTVTAANVAGLVNAAALDLAAQTHAHQVVRDVQITISKAIRSGLRAEAPRIHSELAATFAAAASVVTGASAHFGPDTTAAEVIGGKPDGIELWQKVDGATQTLDAVSQAYRALLANVTRELPDRIESLFVAPGGDLDAAGEMYRTTSRWLALASAGFGLRLNSPSEAVAVVAAANAVTAKLAADERAAANREHARRYMPRTLA